MLAALALLGTAATAQVANTGVSQTAEAGGIADGEWVAYRDMYRDMILFEKYGKPKQLVQSHLRIVPRDKSSVMDGLRLSLVGRSMVTQLPLDGLGRAVFPMSRAAFDSNAELRLNRKAGQFEFRSWLSIAVRADGVYDAVELRAACEQALAYFQYAGESWVRGKQCVGVQFSYPKGDADALVRFRKVDQSLLPLPTKEGGAFPGDILLGFKIMAYRFAEWPQAGQVLTRTAPLAIAPLIEN